MAFTSVTNITDFAPNQAVVGVEYPLSATVVPSGATNKTIVWSLVSGNATVTQVAGQWRLTAHSSGQIVVRATVRNGIQQ